METPAGVVRDAAFFLNVKNFKVRNNTEALEIDRSNKRIRVKALASGDESWIPYDKLVLATGASPIIPPIPGIDKKNVFTLHGVHDAEGIKTLLAEHKAKDVVIVGGGLIGVEATEALATHGCRVTIVEMLPQILNMFDWEIARLVENYMETKGVRIMTNTKALALESREGSGDRATHVRTDKGDLPVDMVILAIGVRPNTSLAKQAGLAIGEKTGAIQVDVHCASVRTSMLWRLCGMHRSHDRTSLLHAAWFHSQQTRAHSRGKYLRWQRSIPRCHGKLDLQNF
jgi:NADPH-dependent 2,4-dienoyl-CoA reductase/sulfur reductase-like enzyme